MKGDFSRIIFDERKNYSVVLMQQGRVQLDSDWNEQALLHWLGMQNLAEDLIGEHGGPSKNSGFEITRTDEEKADLTFTINEGNYYVKGIVCRNDEAVSYTEQEAYPFPDSENIDKDKKYLVYLHVWWRHITSVEDDNIREVALGGPDTTSRIQTVCQVKITEVEAGSINYKNDYEFFIKQLEKNNILKKTTGKLQAQAIKPGDTDQPCIISPRSRYRGNENQLYRVEIHLSGTACNKDATDTEADIADCATFKWSRENGSVVFPILGGVHEDTVTLEHLGRDDRFGLTVGDWVEVVDDNYELQRHPEALLKVVYVDPDNLKVTLSASPKYGKDDSKHPLLRRWDQVGETVYEGSLPVEEGRWIELEDGVQIQFPKLESGNDNPHWYQSGAWWWIPARNATGDVEWPQENGQPLAQGPLDAGDRYAPLALLEPQGLKLKDYRREFIKLWS